MIDLDINPVFRQREIEVVGYTGWNGDVAARTVPFQRWRIGRHDEHLEAPTLRTHPITAGRRWLDDSRRCPAFVPHLNFNRPGSSLVNGKILCRIIEITN